MSELLAGIRENSSKEGRGPPPELRSLDRGLTASLGSLEARSPRPIGARVFFREMAIDCTTRLQYKALPL